jgi:trimeric autotransporter adhesin
MTARDALGISLTAFLLCSLAFAQAGDSSAAIVPRLVNYSGKAIDSGGNAMPGVAGITFAVYKDQYEGTPLWMETQNVTVDAKGNYTVQLGASSSQGLPLDLFNSGEARWLGVRVNGGEEQPRVLLLSVPYALKAADAQTLGGLPASAFQLADVANATTTEHSAVAVAMSASTSASPATSSDVTTSGGTVNSVPLFTTASNVQSSILEQTGSGTTGRIGINTALPASTLDVNGTGTIRGNLSLPATAAATATAGKNSQPTTLTASAYNSSSKAAVAQNFRWQAEPAGNDTAAPSGTVNLLYSFGTATPAETGLKINNKGLLTFAAGQVFPGTGPGTITGVTAGTDLTGGGASGDVTLKVDTTKVPQLNSANIFTGNQTVNGNLSATGTISGGSFEIGSTLFAFGSVANSNAFLGFSGNTAMTGASNTATGVLALQANTTGSSDTASGVWALHSNSSGQDNTASGAYTLSYNTTGSFNTAMGSAALNANTTGNDSTVDGAFALRDNTTGSFNTASGAFALFSNTTGSNNTGSGAYLLYSNTTGGGNTGNGTYTLYNNTTGSNNTGNGTDSLYNNTTGSFNTALGAIAGPDPTTPTLFNSTAIGAFADVAESNALVLGSTAAQNGTTNVLVGIDVSTPTNILTVLQGGGPAIADGWNTYSSRRWKTNIHPLQNALSKVEQLRGVSYDLKDSGKHEIGVIAEEVGKVVPEIVSYEKNGKDATGVDYSRLTALLIEAVKNQQQEISALRKQLQARAAKEAKLESRLEQLEHHRGNQTQLASIHPDR